MSSFEDNDEVDNVMSRPMRGRSDRIDVKLRCRNNNISLNCLVGDIEESMQDDGNNDLGTGTKTENNRSSCGLGAILLASVILFLISLYCIIYNDSERNKRNTFNEDSLNREIKYAGAMFKVPLDELLKLQSGISVVSKTKSTGSFVFLYDSRKKGFCYQSFMDFVESVTMSAARFLRNGADVKPLVLTREILRKVHNHNQLMHEYKSELKKNAVMLVQDADKVPAKLALAFHYFCDEYNPLVEKSSVFFTMDISSCLQPQVRSVTMLSLLDTCMRDKWTSIPEDLISPLLSRVLSVVIVTDTYTYIFA